LAHQEVLSSANEKRSESRGGDHNAGERERFWLPVCSSAVRPNKKEHIIQDPNKFEVTANSPPINLLPKNM
jgi:hypothetical protein